MKNAVIAMLLVLGVSVSSAVLACDGSDHHTTKSSTPAAPAAPAK